jgi:hypothetical protein
VSDRLTVLDTIGTGAGFVVPLWIETLADEILSTEVYAGA